MCLCEFVEVRKNDLETINKEEKVQKNSIIILDFQLQEPNSDFTIKSTALLTYTSTAKHNPLVTM